MHTRQGFRPACVLDVLGNRNKPLDIQQVTIDQQNVKTNY